MAAANSLITILEVLTLPSLGINPQIITFTHATMELEKYIYICVSENSPQNNVVTIDMNMSMPMRRPITSDSAFMNPNNKILALKARAKSLSLKASERQTKNTDAWKARAKSLSLKVSERQTNNTDSWKDASVVRDGQQKRGGILLNCISPRSCMVDFSLLEESDVISNLSIRNCRLCVQCFL